MNGSPANSASPGSRADLTSREAAVENIDASCRVLLLPILGALLWLVISSALALLTSIKLHSPAILANSAWFSYGHIRPAANDAFVYGFASQAGLAVALWMLCRLGRTGLVGVWPVAIASLFWNVGLALGLVGIFSGATTGFDWMEFPVGGSAIMFASYAVLGICALLTFKARRTAELFPSQWYILAALFWFPWLYTTARLLLVWFPVRGVAQLAVSGWFTNGLFTLWLGSLALALLFYFIPKLSHAPLHSRTLALVGFWTLAVFGGWAGFYPGLPLPAWIISVGIASSVVLLIPVLASVLNLWLTLGAANGAPSPLLGFFKTSLICFALSGVLAVFTATIPQLRLSLFGEGLEQLALYGFIGLALFGAIHHLVPRLTGAACHKFIALNCWATLLGLVLYAGALILGGVLQQKKLVNGVVPFVEIMAGTKPFIRISTVGLLLIFIGNLAILLRVLSLLVTCGRTCLASCCAPAVKLKPAEATR